MRKLGFVLFAVGSAASLLAGCNASKAPEQPVQTAAPAETSQPRIYVDQRGLRRSEHHRFRKL